MVYYYEDSSDDEEFEDGLVPKLVIDVVDSDLQEDSRHLKCEKCPRLIFQSADELRRHKVNNSKTHDYCALCDEDFKDYELKSLHLLNSDKHITCCVCTCEFKSPGGLSIHMKQNHKEKDPGKCPACGERYTTQSGLLQHIESNLCIGGLRRSAIHNSILEEQEHLHKSNVSSISQGSSSTMHSPLDLDDEEQMPMEETASTIEKRRGVRVLETDSTPQFLADTMVDIKDEWFDLKLRVWRCPYKGCNKKYPLLNSFEQHINSPTHQTKNFRCPGCLDRFPSSSALLQHIESNSCRVTQTAHLSDVKKGLTAGVLR